MRETFLDKKDNKNSLLKKNILFLCIERGEHSIASISEAIGASVPTATKLIGELMDEGFMIDLGKSGTSEPTSKAASYPFRTISCTGWRPKRSLSKRLQKASANTWTNRAWTGTASWAWAWPCPAA